MQPDPFLLTLLNSGVAHCRTVAIENGGLLASLFLAGLIGSATHCVGMCGPFVLAQTVARLEGLPASQMREWHRLAGAALLPYHLGRATPYAFLGAMAAALASGTIAVSGLQWISPALLIGAAVFFLGYALREASVRWHRAPAREPAVVDRDSKRPPSRVSTVSRAISRVTAPLFARPTGWRGYGLGVALGFLPCGLLYGALAAAAASGRPLAGALAMLAFTLGTIPALLAVGLAGHVSGNRFRATALRLAPALMLINAAALSYLAWRTLA
ncbi:MAG: sulfite exporter TauE/SafE family protein [Rhodospirillales bacterium]|nr:sulfite exporter TauE/SafE family protein [Rhodospirillales bacterium]